MANRQGNVDLRLAQVSAPHLELWLGVFKGLINNFNAWTTIGNFLRNVDEVHGENMRRRELHANVQVENCCHSISKQTTAIKLILIM